MSREIGRKMSRAVACDRMRAIQNAPKTVPATMAMKRCSRAEISAVSDYTVMLPTTPRSSVMGRTTWR